MRPKLTIFTPTFDRAYILPTLFESLKRQTSKDFLWLVIDDGSTDDTEELIKTWQDSTLPFVIKYHKQENGGKQRAHNTAVELCETELFLCVDSDDFLIDKAVELILNTWNPFRNDPSISGIIALKGYDPSTPMGSNLPDHIKKTPLTELYQKHGFTGETALIFRTSILKNYSYDVVEGEKFITESYIYLQIDQKYSMMILDRIINICGYQDDGYTKNIFRIIYNNPRSYMRLKNLSMELATNPKHRFLNAVNLISAFFIIRRRDNYFSWNVLTILAIVPGYLLYLKRFHKYCKQT